ncbi:hypothetical protein BJ878DRAFT_486951 [Calycina marina]|uniref:ER transporter 6TM N-terminal domain-containing protein n=1 Tax=Calycina marina TaxID=1763456 RepID=A0A9P7ZC50_9HELO|nr:hypothetical protein BJ878DRAFT_486951 [Calycina marina]
MASTPSIDAEVRLGTLLRRPSEAKSEVKSEDVGHAADGPKARRRLHRKSQSGNRHVTHDAQPPPHHSHASPSIYMGSFTHSPRRSRASLGVFKSPQSSAPTSPRMSMSQVYLDSLLQDLNPGLDTYGVEELRDGFFDGSFFKPPAYNHDDLMREARYSLPAALKKKHPLSSKHFLPKQWRGIKNVVRDLTTTRASIKLFKTFSAVFISYILCLVPVIREWLGPYCYIIAISALINHPGRTLGAEVDGALLTILGSATGLGWGAFALWASDATPATREGYGGVLSMFLVLFMGVIAVMRSYYIRLYQFVLPAGIAIIWACLADASEQVDWHKLYRFGVPCLCGQAIALIICSTVFPDAGARPLAVSLHDAFSVMNKTLKIPHHDPITLHRQLSWTFVQVSQAYRDLALDISVTRFRPTDVLILRNLIQGVIRSQLAIKAKHHLFDDLEVGISQLGSQEEVAIDIDRQRRPTMLRTPSVEKIIRHVADRLAEPTSDLLACMRSSLTACDAVLMTMSGYRQYLGPDSSVSSDVLGALTKIRKIMIVYDVEEENLLENSQLPAAYSSHPDIVELFLFVHPIRQAATSVERLLIKVMEMQQRRPGWKLYFPSYPLAKASQRTNAQVRHDRGGVTAGFYFRSQTQLARTMRGMANIYKPLPRHAISSDDAEEEQEMNGVDRSDTMGKYEEEEDEAMNSKSSQTSRKKRLRHRLWVVVHRLQGFEARFALKVVLVTALLSVPAWLQPSRGWWNENESWWCVVSVWIMMHPRVGGNFQDLITRAFCAALGALWGGISYGVANGNPYVMAVFAALYMIPMLYRYTQSNHPRSGIMGCMSFIVVSLSTKVNHGLPSVVQIAWTRGVAFIVGIVAGVLVNWILWPFVARHELRKALSSMMIYSSIIYRGVVAKYVYYETGEEPGKADIERSEMLEGRLREGFVRIRQLMALTQHEIRLRGPFNPLPYSALIEACERFFEYIVAVRQSSLFFHPHYMSDDEQAAESLLGFRRDAVAAVLMNLYILAGALRGDQKVPRYLPSAAAARKRLLDYMARIEMAQAQLAQDDKGERDEAMTKPKPGRRWAQIYSYSYSQSLTGCVQQLEQLQKYTKEIVGEQGFDQAAEIDEDEE